MLGDLSFVILREIIKRIDEYESIDNLKFLNKRLNNFILNDLPCQERYFSLRYPKIKINLDSYNLGTLINLLNSKKYSKFIETKIPTDEEELVFVNPQNDSFIVFNRYYTASSCNRNFHFTNFKMAKNLIKIVDNYIDDFEDILLSKKYFRLELKIPMKFYKYYNTDYNYIWSWIPFKSSDKKQLRPNIILYTETFNHNILKIINDF